jgi:hypothetical protein
MYEALEGGSIYEVHDNSFGFVFKCNLPPVGYGVSSITGELKEVDVLKRSDIPEEQYWERYTLPHWWKERRKYEKERQQYDRYYFDPTMEEIRKREWDRRTCGVWFWNYNPYKKESELRYITGTHYLYVTYWKFQGRWMDFRMNDMELWYIIRYIETDPYCLGINEITKRKLGKTARLGCWLYERTSRRPTNQHAGLQSKADDDAEEVMKKAIVQPWQKLPDFFRPIYDTMKGDDPNELRFFHTSRRGGNADQERDEEEALESWIDFGSSGEGVYDGPELDSYGSDEAGKTKRPVSIKERQATVRFCAEIDGTLRRSDWPYFQRKQWYTTTVEIDKDKKTGAYEEENYEFQEMTAMSNPLKRNENGMTLTGLYTYFLPAQKGMFFDKYGYPDEQRAITYLLNARKQYEDEGKTRELSSFKRKNPMTFLEAFSADGSQTLYDPEVLSEQLDNISWGDDQTERGNLLWEGGHEIFKIVEHGGERKKVISKVYWETNPNGKYEKLKGWFPKNPNSVYEKNECFFPNSSYEGRAGCDPFKYDKTKDKRRSNCAAFYYQMPHGEESEFSDTFTLRYAFREKSTRLANMDVLKMLWWCGCQGLFERNVNHWKRDFQDWNCAGFLMWLPGEVEPGVYMDTPTIQTICNYTESYINKSIKKVKFKTLIRKETGWLGFRVEDTEKFDEPMGAGITLLAVHGKKYALPKPKTQSIESILPLNKAI